MEIIFGDDSSDRPESGAVPPNRKGVPPSNRKCEYRARSLVIQPTGIKSIVRSDAN